MYRFITLMFIALCLIVGCTKAEESAHLTFGEISLDFSEEAIREVMGKPTSIEEKNDSIKEIYYQVSKGPGAIFTLVGDRLTEALWYPSMFDPDASIPMNFEDLDLSGVARIEQVDCYHDGKCNNYVYEQGSETLQIIMDWENKKIDRVYLK